MPKTLTWSPTQTSAKLADVGGERAASVKAEVDVTSTVTMSWCLAASMKLPGRVVPQVPAAGTPFTEATIPWASAGTIVTSVAASAPEKSVPRTLTWSPTQTSA